MICAPATAEDFTKWEARAKLMDIYALDYSARECMEVATLMDSWNPVRAGYYRDQAYTYQKEINSRRS